MYRRRFRRYLMSYRVLMVSQLVQSYNIPFTLFKQEDRVIYEAKRAMSVAYADSYYIATLAGGHQLACM